MKFYEIKPTRDATYFSIEHENEDPDRLVPRYCPRCNEPISKLPWLPPCSASLDRKTLPPTDFAFTGSGYFIITERVRKLFDNLRPRGIAAMHPVAIVKPKVKETYYYPEIAYSDVRLGEKASGVRWLPEKPVCSVCGGWIWRIERHIVDMDTWDGRDIFQPFARATRLCTQRIHDMIMNEKITGVHLIPADASGFDLYPWRTEKESS